MRDALGRTARVGDFVTVAARAGNIAQFKFGVLYEIDKENRRFKIRREDASVSNWMQWYYHDIERREYCKVLLVSE